jgi:hypothetical protein
MRGLSCACWCFVSALMLVGLVAGPSGADCIIQDSSGVMRGVSLGDGRVVVRILVRGEPPEATTIPLRRITGLSSVVTGTWDKRQLVFQGITDGTWQIPLRSEQIEVVVFERWGGG